MSECPPAVWMR